MSRRQESRTAFQTRKAEELRWRAERYAELVETTREGPARDYLRGKRDGLLLAAEEVEL